MVKKTNQKVLEKKTQNNRSRPVKREYSAGGAVFKRLKFQSKKAEILWLVIQPRAENEPWRQGRWQLPKGWIDEGETGRQAAVREVEEEGGVRAKIIGKIGRIDVFFNNEKKQKVIKNIVFFLMRYQSGSEQDHDQETQKAVWLPFEKAYDRLTFKSEKEILEKAGKMAEEEESRLRLF